MTKREVAKFKELLLEKREDVLSEINHIVKENLKSQKGAPGDPSGYRDHMADMADMASDSYERELSLDLANNEQEVLYDIDEALKRINEGIYGICTECNKKIPFIRLNALPYVKHCIQCQSKEENTKR